MPTQTETAGEAHPRRLGRLLTAAILLAVVNTAYLSWRYLALQAGWAAAGTSLCSWTEGIDCDKVLLTKEARAFYFPNALLGFGFWLGCLVWWEAGRRLGPDYRRHVLRTLAFWLAVAALFTLRFFWLLIHLDALCPLCPWNHLLVYIALALALVLCRRAPAPARKRSHAPLVLLVAFCVSQFWLWLSLWALARAAGRL
ncbi:MAG TPA: vitamin K epoxide reductase family protein [Pyrinomonadaceae bacterium]|nr:vitamin K epoxide reductase family protein [Pyrinomonadaceae bacterium]